MTLPSIRFDFNQIKMAIRVLFADHFFVISEGPFGTSAGGELSPKFVNKYMVSFMTELGFKVTKPAVKELRSRMEELSRTRKVIGE